MYFDTLYAYHLYFVFMIFLLSFIYPNSVDVLVQSSLNIVDQDTFRSDSTFTYWTILDIVLWMICVCYSRLVIIIVLYF